jgi:short-subunit dehydrogenase
LINNAGIVTGKKFLESSDTAIEKTFQVNTLAHFWVGLHIFIQNKYIKDYFKSN